MIKYTFLNCVKSLTLVFRNTVVATVTGCNRKKLSSLHFLVNVMDKICYQGLLIRDTSMHFVFLDLYLSLDLVQNPYYEKIIILFV